jgi:DNA primase
MPLLTPGFSLRFALLPAGLDPDDLIRSEGPQRLAEILAAAQPLVDTVWALEAAGRRLDTPERRAGFRAALKSRIGAIADAAVRQDYAAEMERRLEALFGGGRRGGPRESRNRAGGARPGAWRPGPALVGGDAARRGVAGLVRRQQEILLSTLINHPELLAECAEEAAQLRFPGELDKLRQALLNLSARISDLDSEELKRQLNSLGHGNALAHLMSERVLRNVSYGRVDAPLELARRGWTEAVRRYRDLDERGEIELAGRSLAVNEQKWDAFRRRITALDRAASEDADAEF